MRQSAVRFRLAFLRASCWDERRSCDRISPLSPGPVLGRSPGQDQDGRLLGVSAGRSVEVELVGKRVKLGGEGVVFARGNIATS